MAIAWVFPGQGSQKVGMADHLLSLSGASERFGLASELLGRDLLAICRGESGRGEGPNDLNDTRNTQLALFVVESLLADSLLQQGRTAKLVAGHSLGELVALYAGGAFDLETGIKLMKIRSELMASAGGGAMTAIIGFDRSQLEDLVATTEGVAIANDNSDTQVVISGLQSAVAAVSNQLTCKRVIPLVVSGAFHSPLMAEAAAHFSDTLNATAFGDTRMPVLSNSNPRATNSGDLLKERLKQQMTTGVRWRETMIEMTVEGVDTLVEIGPGNILSGLAKRSMKGVTATQISSAGDLGQ
ncbi:ACP S-malonyltransferase [Synechococcus sp. M16CYN]|uniref:ACP S-malonyltransferase n=1 Tax=Synechococcus sp. M16CYN TaxID=3103139 RepID=UPI0032450E42